MQTPHTHQRELTIVSLHRYYSWARTLRTHFERPFKEWHEKGLKEENVEEWFGPTGMGEGVALMSYWYAALYVVIEGWRELGLKDDRIDELLTSEHADRLRVHRNATCHYQAEYFVKKWNRFEKEPGSVEWVWALDREFSRFFMKHTKDNMERVLSSDAPTELKEFAENFLARYANNTPPAQTNTPTNET